VFSQVDLAVKTGKLENLIESWNGPYIDPQSSKLIQFGPRPLRGAPFASIAHFVLHPQCWVACEKVAIFGTLSTALQLKRLAA